MKAFVTGGSGFIGFHLVKELIRKGIDVHVLDIIPANALPDGHAHAVLHREDIRSKKAKQIILQEKPDVIFHLAAQTDVGKSISDPQYDADVNINGTINILEASHQASVKKIIFASTSGVYGNLKKEVITEEDLTVPISYYGLSKLTAEAYIRLFAQLHGMSYTILRYGNVYGPGQLTKGEGGVIAVFLDRMKRRMPVNIYGDGEQTRDFIYVNDVVRANIAAIDRGHQKTIHISTAKKTSINQLVGMLAQIHGVDIDAVYKPRRKGDIKHSCLDNRKARQWLGWHPQVEIFQGLKETYDAFLERGST